MTSETSELEELRNRLARLERDRNTIPVSEQTIKEDRLNAEGIAALAYQPNFNPLGKKHKFKLGDAIKFQPQKVEIEQIVEEGPYPGHGVIHEGVNSFGGLDRSEAYTQQPARFTTDYRGPKLVGQKIHYTPVGDKVPGTIVGLYHQEESTVSTAPDPRDLCWYRVQIRGSIIGVPECDCSAA